MNRIAIIDDEPAARQLLRTMLTTLCPQVEICGEANSVESAYVLIRQTQPNGILLDISMEDGTGFDLLDKFPNPNFQVIFTTAHDRFALMAFRYHALDYLLKPINPLELVQAMDRIKAEPPENLSTRINNLLESVKTKKIEKITLSSQEGMVFVQICQIIRLESEGSYTTFHLSGNEQHFIARPMKKFETMLPEDQFFQIHQSHIINISYVKKILKEDGGFVLMQDGARVPIARRRKDEFMELMR